MLTAAARDGATASAQSAAVHAAATSTRSIAARQRGSSAMRGVMRVATSVCSGTPMLPCSIDLRCRHVVACGIPLVTSDSIGVRVRVPSCATRHALQHHACHSCLHDHAHCLPCGATAFDDALASGSFRVSSRHGLFLYRTIDRRFVESCAAMSEARAPTMLPSRARRGDQRAGGRGRPTEAAHQEQHHQQQRAHADGRDWQQQYERVWL